MVSLVRAAAAEFSQHGLRVNTIAPGAILTDNVAVEFAQKPALRHNFECHTPLRRAGNPREVAEAAAWLPSDRSSYVTGVVLPVDGGLLATRL